MQHVIILFTKMSIKGEIHSVTLLNTIEEIKHRADL